VVRASPWSTGMAEGRSTTAAPSVVVTGSVDVCAVASVSQAPDGFSDVLMLCVRRSLQLWLLRTCAGPTQGEAPRSPDRSPSPPSSSSSSSSSSPPPMADRERRRSSKRLWSKPPPGPGNEGPLRTTCQPCKHITWASHQLSAEINPRWFEGVVSVVIAAGSCRNGPLPPPPRAL
jgi:hypothetical protein